MPFILETIVTTLSPDGSLHLVPFGLIQDGDDWILAPFRPSPTIANLEASPYFAASSPSDVRVIAGCVTGRRDWPVVDCDRIPGRRLADSFGLSSICEGVETAAQAAHLAAQGWESAQGFHFGVPAPEESWFPRVDAPVATVQVSA